MTTGKRGCSNCDGRGWYTDQDGWHRCPCTRVTPRARQVQRRFGSVGTDGLTLRDRITRHQRENPR